MAGLWTYLIEDHRAIYQADEEHLSIAKAIRKYVSSLPFRTAVLYRLSHCLWVRGHKLWATTVQMHLYHSVHADISARAQIGPGIRMPHPMGVVIGDSVRIGKNACILQGVTLGGNHGKEDNGRTQPTIGDNCFIGAHATVIGPVRLGNRVTIGANALVNKSWGDNTVLAGVPAVPLH